MKFFAYANLFHCMPGKVCLAILFKRFAVCAVVAHGLFRVYCPISALNKVTMSLAIFTVHGTLHSAFAIGAMSEPFIQLMEFVVRQRRQIAKNSAEFVPGVNCNHCFFLSCGVPATLNRRSCPVRCAV